jgi:uncharacterized integral membrane protein
MKDSRSQSRATQLKAAVVGVLALLTVVVVFQNTSVVDTRVLFGTLTMPLALLLALTFGTGLLTGAFLLRHFTRPKPQVV